MAAQLTLTKGFSLRSESWKIRRAAISLPTPLSPRMSTVALVLATFSMVSRASIMRGEALNKLGKEEKGPGPNGEPAASSVTGAGTLLSESKIGERREGRASDSRGKVRNSRAPSFAAANASVGLGGATGMTGSSGKLWHAEAKGVSSR